MFSETNILVMQHGKDLYLYFARLGRSLKQGMHIVFSLGRKILQLFWLSQWESMRRSGLKDLAVRLVSVRRWMY